jgi:hypothetical protein
MNLLAGQSEGHVRGIKAVGPIVHDLVEEAGQIISQRLAALVGPEAVAHCLAAVSGLRSGNSTFS